MTEYKYLVVDTETTGLHRESRIWEIAGAVLNTETLEEQSRFKQFVTLNPKDIENAKLDGIYLQNMESRYMHAEAKDIVAFTEWVFENINENQKPIWVGSNPHFDLKQIQKYSNAEKIDTAHYVYLLATCSHSTVERLLGRKIDALLDSCIYYKPIDVTTLLAPLLQLQPWATTDEIATQAEIDLTQFERHSAIGDVELNIALLKKYKELESVNPFNLTRLSPVFAEHDIHDK